MDNEKLFYTVAELADVVGVSKQAIYKRIKKDLAEYTKAENGKTYIHRDAVQLFSQDEYIPPIETEKPAEGYTEGDTVKSLREQLAEKERVIKEQQDEIRELNRHIRTQAETMADIIQKQNQLQENFQILLARGQSPVSTVQPVERMVEMVEQPVETSEEPHTEFTAGEQFQPVERMVEMVKQPVETTKKKRKGRFWRWLFEEKDGR